MKNCQKLILGVCLAVGLAIAFTGCASGSKATVYDESVPLEQSSTLIFVNVTVMTFNGETMGYKPSWMGHNSLSRKQVIIPAGNHTLSIYAEYASLNTGYKLDVEYAISQEFLAGHTYAVQKNGVNYGDGISLTDITELLKEFVPNSSGSDASILEGKWVSDNSKEEYIFSGNQFITVNNGKYGYRGFFSIEKDKINMAYLVNYSKGKWNVFLLASLTSLDFDGTTMTATGFGNKKIVFKKVE